MNFGEGENFLLFSRQDDFFQINYSISENPLKVLLFLSNLNKKVLIDWKRQCYKNSRKKGNCCNKLFDSPLIELRAYILLLSINWRNEITRRFFVTNFYKIDSWWKILSIMIENKFFWCRTLTHYSYWRWKIKLESNA